MRLIEVNQKGELDITPEILIITAFKSLWDRDKTVKKKKALEQLGFVYYMCDWESPYNKYIPEERERKIIDDIFNTHKDWKPDKLIKQACVKYEEMQETLTLLVLRDAHDALHKLRNYFRNVDLDLKDKSGKKVNSAKDLMSNLKTIGSVLSSLKDIEEEVKKELSEKFTIRGGGAAGFFEDPE